MITAFDLKQGFRTHSGCLQTRSLMFHFPALLCLGPLVFSVHHVNWFQGVQKGFCVVATCPLQEGWLTETAGVWIRRVTQGNRIPQKVGRESGQSKTSLNMWRSFENVFLCSHWWSQRKLMLFLYTSWHLQTCELVAKGRPWEQLPAAGDLACVTTRCHGCPTEATLSHSSGSSQDAALLAAAGNQSTNENPGEEAEPEPGCTLPPRRSPKVGEFRVSPEPWAGSAQHNEGRELEVKD